MLNPVFSPKHMRDLAPIFFPIAHQLRDLLTLRVKESDEEIDMSTWMSRAALEYIGQGGMGYEFDALDQKKTNKYHDAVKLFVYCLILRELLAVADYPQYRPTLAKHHILQQFVPYLVKIGSPWFRRKMLELWPSKDIQKVVNIVDIMHDQSVEVYEAKKEALTREDDTVIQQVGKGKDILSILRESMRHKIT